MTGKNTIISANSLITGNYNLTIGDKSYIGKKVHINLSRDVKTGNDVGVGENTVIWTHGYYPPADKGYPVTYKPVEIKDNSWVSTNIIILPGVVIGENVIVGAESVVTKSVTENKIIAGNPAQVIKEVETILSKENFLTLIRNVLLKNQNCKNFIEVNENYYTIIL
jgi:acetyltransferase-like isoleucine patch superfamily enzyme